jgi:hypothetical protein
MSQQQQQTQHKQQATTKNNPAKISRDAPGLNMSKTTYNNLVAAKALPPEEYTYFVRLPHSGYEFKVRSMLVMEENALKLKNSTPLDMYNGLLQIMYDCISPDVKVKGHPFETYDGFIRNISLQDRDTILFAIINQTYEETHEMLINCGRCGHRSTPTVNLNNYISFNHYTGEEPILVQRVPLKIPEYEWIVYFRLPTVFDELQTLINGNKHSGNPKSNEEHTAAVEFIYIDKIEFVAHDDPIPGMGVRQSGIREDVVDNYIMIYSMIKNKPARLRKKISKFFADTFRDYGVFAKFETTCEKCDASISVNINPVNHFLFLVQ